MADLMSTEDNLLVGWCLSHVQDGVDYRNTNFKDKWDEYYRLWRGIHTEQDKTRGSERSKLIAPALQQAIEVAVAELEEATFGRGRWFDVVDDLPDEEKEDMLIFRNLMHEDLDEAGVRSAMSEIFLNSSLYGTGIGKIVVEEVDNKEVAVINYGGLESVQGMGAVSNPKIKVTLVAVPPDEFAIDPAARTINEALYCAHIMPVVPRHSVLEKQETGVYRDIDLGGYPDDQDVSSKGENKSTKMSDKVKIVEYHGLVPADLLGVDLAEDEEFEEIDTGEEDENIFEYDDTNLVEAIVTIANDSVLLKAVRNPYTMEDRCFIAYQHDTVPNRFYGRGVAEKGYNPQKALDAELRGRMDAMALAIHPMMAMDATRIPRGGDLGVRPGKTILTNGDPRSVLMPFNFGQVGTNTFAQSGDLERQIQMGTGSMDSATPVGISPRNETASGMSMMLSGAIKRSKRTLANIERMFTKPFVKKAAWRFMQFDPERYPVRDAKFVVHSTLGIMARELEQQQLTGLLQTVPSDSPAFWMLLRSIYEYSSIANREQMIAIIDQMTESILNPQPPQPSFEEQIKMQELQIKAQNEQARIQVELLRARAELARIELEATMAPDKAAKLKADTMLSTAKAEAEELGTQLDKYRTITDALRAESEARYDAARGSTLQQPTGNVQQ